MLGKKHRPVNGIHIGSSIPCNKIRFEHKTTQSPKGINKSFDFGGVGLGIVAALQISGEPANRALITRNSSRSNPIPVSPPPKYPRWVDKGFAGKMESESLEEEYTIVTHHSANKSRTKVYGRGGRWDEEPLFRTQNGVKSGRDGIFHISPARFGDGAAGGAPAADFLISCHLCRKKLQGEDIYMYRGEKGFCSTECRYREIMMDERRENCSSEAMRGVDLSSSGANANGQIFATGILAI